MEELNDLLMPPNKRDKDGVQIREENNGIKVSIFLFYIKIFRPR